MTTLKEKLTQKIEQHASQEMVVVNNQSSQEALTLIPPSDNLTKVDSILAPPITPDLTITLNDAKDRLRLLNGFIKDMMTPGIDYGLIPGCNKPTLLKPGAEKLCEFYSYGKLAEVINRVENWDNGFFHFEVKVILFSKRTGETESVGLGCCNSKEKQYKNKDAYNIANTILKMAEKRAFIDATLSATRTSSTFTQDIEDMYADPVPPTKKQESSIPTPDKVTPIDKKQLTEIFNFVSQHAIAIGTVKILLQNRYGVDASVKLTSAQAEDLKAQLKTLVA